MQTPCVKNCTLDFVTDLCFGCGRTLEEIIGWAGFDDAERKRVMAELPQRIKKLKPD